MPASLAPVTHGRARRLAAGVCTSALTALAFASAAAAADRELTVRAGTPATWQGRAALTSAVFDPATLTPCGATEADVCDTTLVHVDGPGTLSLRTAAVDADTPDVDLYVFRSDTFRLPGAPAAVSAGGGAAETVTLPAAQGDYLVAVVSFAGGKSGFAGQATLDPRAGVAPDVDHPRGLQDELVSDDAGAVSQPALALDGSLAVAAYRVFPDPAVYASRIATAVSFNRGERWEPLGELSAGSNPALAFSGSAAVLVTNEANAVVARWWDDPSRSDVRRGRTWSAPQPLSAPPAGAVDDRPVVAASWGAVLVCWVRTTDLGAYGRQAVLCRRSADGGATWSAETRLSPAATPGVPYGPYVGGVAVAGRRGQFSVGWIDTLAGTLDGTGLDAAWVVQDGGEPVRVARFAPLPQHFAADGFRNVGLLSLAAGREGLYLAYATQVDGQADIQLVRSHGAWELPETIGGDLAGADQFQPSVAVRGRRVYVSFLDRRLDPSGTFIDEWLASSPDGGRHWEQKRLSHDSWDAAIGAPHSPTGDLLGDHQALAADRCGPLALAADTHRANASSRDRDFDRHAARSSVPQLFAWRDRRCD